MPLSPLILSAFLACETSDVRDLQRTSSTKDLLCTPQPGFDSAENGFGETGDESTSFDDEDQYTVCNSEQLERIWSAKEWRQANRTELEPLILTICEESPEGYCPEDTESVVDTLFDKEWSPIAYCPSKQLQSKGGQLYKARAYGNIEEDRLVPGTPPAYGIYPVGLEQDHCGMASILLHEDLHLITGEIHDLKPVCLPTGELVSMPDTKDWIYRVSNAVNGYCYVQAYIQMKAEVSWLDELDLRATRHFTY